MEAVNLTQYLTRKEEYKNMGTFAFGGTNLKKGATGDTVKRIQEALNANGANLTVDGIWGDNTDAALRKFQTDNSLTVDGIYGTQTHNALFGIAGSNTKPTEPDSYSDIDLSQYSSGYQKSDEVIAADKKKTDAENAVSNYGDFAYGKQDEFKAIMDKILNREKFSYDFNGDALYQQYKDKYVQQGKMAMQDTMGQAAAMTGGYGNSYAATVGNQAYQAHLNNLNDVIPELYQMAYDKYNQEGQDLYNQYGMLSDDRSTEYAMWGDKYNRLVSDRDYYGNEANNAYVKDYGEWSDNRTYDQNQYWKENEFGYGKYRDSVTDWENDRAFQEAQRQFNEQQALNEAQFEYQKKTSNLGTKKAEEEENTGYKMVDTQGVKNFQAGIKTKNEFNTRGGEDKAKYGTYSKYIDGKLDQWLSEGRLTEEEVATLIAYYGL